MQPSTNDAIRTLHTLDQLWADIRECDGSACMRLPAEFD